MTNLANLNLGGAFGSAGNPGKGRMNLGGAWSARPVPTHGRRCCSLDPHMFPLCGGALNDPRRRGREATGRVWMEPSVTEYRAERRAWAVCVCVYN